MDDLPDADGLHRFAARLARKVPWLSADDLLQDARLAVWHSGAWGDPPALVCRVARRRMIDSIRTVTGRPHVTVCKGCGERTVTVSHSLLCPRCRGGWTAAEVRYGSLGVTLWDEDHPVGGVEERVIAALDLEDVVGRIGRLGVRDRDVLLAELRGETLREVGVRYGVSESRVCQIRSRVRKRLEA